MARLKGRSEGSHLPLRVHEATGATRHLVFRVEGLGFWIEG